LLAQVPSKICPKCRKGNVGPTGLREVQEWKEVNAHDPLYRREITDLECDQCGHRVRQTEEQGKRPLGKPGPEDKEGIERRVSGLLAAEAIIAGFLFASTAIQWQAMQEYFRNPPIPASTFLATFINFCLIIVAVRCIWLSLKAFDNPDGREWYLASYRIFVVVLLCAILFNVLPSMLSTYRIYAVQSWTTPQYAQCVKLIQCYPNGERNILVLPDEKPAAEAIGIVAAVLVLLTFLFPKTVSGYLLHLWNSKRLLGFAIGCFLVGFVAIASGYPTMCCENGFAPPQASLYVEFLIPGFAGFHKTYGCLLVLFGMLSLIVATVALGIAFVDWRSAKRTRSSVAEFSHVANESSPQGDIKRPSMQQPSALLPADQVTSRISNQEEAGDIRRIFIEHDFFSSLDAVLLLLMPLATLGVSVVPQLLALGFSWTYLAGFIVIAIVVFFVSLMLLVRAKLGGSESVTCISGRAQAWSYPFIFLSVFACSFAVFATTHLVLGGEMLVIPLDRLFLVVFGCVMLGHALASYPTTWLARKMKDRMPWRSDEIEKAFSSTPFVRASYRPRRWALIQSLIGLALLVLYVLTFVLS
jgi:hypothetical protein